MANALLDQIANPNVPNFNAAFDRGREGARQERSRNALGQVLGGNKAAMPELMSADPQAGFEVQKYLSQLDENSRKTLAQNTEMAARELIGVSQIQDPQQKLSAWQQALQRHKGMGIDTSSYEGLDPDSGMNVAASRILPVADLLKQGKPANLPNSVEEFKFALQQGYRGSYQDWMREQKTQTQQFRLDNPPAPKARPLPQPAVTKLTDAGTDLETLSRLDTTFEEGFGGHPILGDLANTIGRIAGDDTGQAQWWQDYQSYQNEIRNRLFGSALTLPEKGEFQKAMITPRMEAGEIRKNLARQAEIASRAAQKLARSYLAQGYNQEAIDELIPPELYAAPAAQGEPAQPSGGEIPQISTDEEFDALPPGTEFMGPDGQIRVKP